MMLTRAQIKQTVRAALATWRPLLDLEHWEIDIYWKDLPDTSDGAVMGVYCASPQYEAASLYVNVELIFNAHYSRKQIEYDVVHECCHVPLAQITRLAEMKQPGDRVSDANETATKKFASALWRTRYGCEPPTAA